MLSSEAISLGCLVERSTHKSSGTVGSISGLDPFSASASGEACDCSVRQYLPVKNNVAANLLSRGSPRPGEGRLHPAVVWEIWAQFGVAQVDVTCGI